MCMHAPRSSVPREFMNWSNLHERDKLKIIIFKTYVQYSVQCPLQDFCNGISINPVLTGQTVPGTVGGISLNEGIPYAVVAWCTD